MRILHVEDYDPGKGQDYSKLLRAEAEKNGFSYDWTDNLRDAKLKISEGEYDVFVLDGQFPAEVGADPDKNNFIELFSFLIGKGVPKGKIIVWSNSTTVHNYCYDNGIKCFSKKEMTPEDYTKKGNDPEKIVERMDVEEIVEEVQGC